MNVRWGWLILLSVLVGLIACSKSQNSVDPAARRLCQSLCVKQLESCQHACDNACPQCLSAGYADADRDYKEFIHQQTVQGGLVARDLNSYRDPLQCVKPTCHCRADYYQCAEACTGKIHKRLQPPLICC